MDSTQKLTKSLLKNTCECVTSQHKMGASFGGNPAWPKGQLIA